MSDNPLRGVGARPFVLSLTCACAGALLRAVRPGAAAGQPAEERGTGPVHWCRQAAGSRARLWKVGRDGEVLAHGEQGSL